MKSVETDGPEEELVKEKYDEFTTEFGKDAAEFYREDIGGHVPCLLEHHDGRGQCSFSSEFGFRLACLGEVDSVTEPKDSCIRYQVLLGGTESEKDHDRVEADVGPVVRAVQEGVLGGPRERGRAGEKAEEAG